MIALDDFTPEEYDVLSDWHGGLHSMMYAVVSTGYLATGTLRPNGASDQSWANELVAGLEDECTRAANHAQDIGEDEHAFILDEIARRCAEYLDGHPDEEV